MADLKDLHYYLFSSTIPESEHAEIHNRLYAFWLDLWRKEFKALGFDSSGLEDDFARQDLIACITHQGDPVACHLYTFFSLEVNAARSHRYLKGNYNDLYYERMKNMGVSSVMSMEFLSVHPDWRKHRIRPHLGTVMCSLALYTLDHFRVDAAIAPARRDHKVNEIAYSIGGDCVVENVINHNVPCDLIAIRRDKIRLPDEPGLGPLVDRLWQERTVSAMIRTEPLSPKGPTLVRKAG
jgi:hypothetical protein